MKGNKSRWRVSDSIVFQLLMVLVPRELFHQFKPRRLILKLKQKLPLLLKPHRLLSIHKQQTNEQLQEQVASTYSNLRYGLAVISFCFPPFLPLIGRYWYGIPFQNSMSAYYFAESTGEGAIRGWLTGINFGAIKFFLSILAGLDNTTSMRSWFVGILFVLGIFLYLYKGFSWQENILLNVAGLCALGVALFPTEWNCGTRCHLVTSHTLFAIGVFVSMALVAVLCARQTLNDLPLKNTTKTQAYLWWYRGLGVLMFLFPLLAWFITTILLQDKSKFTFFVEWFGIVLFALYWLIKSNELSEKRAEIRVIKEGPVPSSEQLAQTASIAPLGSDRIEPKQYGDYSKSVRAKP